MTSRLIKLAEKVPALKAWGAGNEDNFTEALEAFGQLVVLDCANIADWCINTGPNQLVETVMAERVRVAIKNFFDPAVPNVPPETDLPSNVRIL